VRSFSSAAPPSEVIRSRPIVIEFCRASIMPLHKDMHPRFEI